MALRLGNVTFDCDDTLAVAGFWSAALGRSIDPDPTEVFASVGISDEETPKWYFAKVPESKAAKNRCHVDLYAENRDAVPTEVERLVALGATVIRDPKEEYGAYWATLQDPEGNEFCIGG
ncbi:MAG TPA: VOC family protein [Acidimicrobiales bacterium]|jgi:predicted enzyme related to lactoylglutathione lyase